MKTTTTTGSAVLDAMLSAGFRLSEKATYSGKDDKVSLSRVKIGGTLAADKILDNKAIVAAVAAGDGGQLSANGVSDAVSAKFAAIGVNAVLGYPLTSENAIDIASNILTRETVRQIVGEANERQDALHDAIMAESAKRQAGKIDATEEVEDVIESVRE
tara:strand:- start:813 stop:1289 length:477 start_codon:yes stop_codon:yes gene_type:complete